MKPVIYFLFLLCPLLFHLTQEGAIVLLHDRQRNGQEEQCMWRVAASAPNSIQPLQATSRVSSPHFSEPDFLQLVMLMYRTDNTTIKHSYMVQTTDIFQTQHLAGLQSLINPYKNDLNSFPHKLPHMTYTLPKFLPRSLHPPKIVPPVIIVYLIYAFFFLVQMLVACRDGPVARGHRSGLCVV